MFTLDLSHPDCDPPDCPAWAKETVPPEMAPFRGRNGLPEVYRARRRPIAMTVRGVDRYHANQFIVHRPETAHYLYETYTPLEVGYTQGLLPSFETWAAACGSNARTAREKALAFLDEALPRFPHPDAPPFGPWVEPDRNLEDEALLASGCGWCNEQTRVFIRLCQVSGIPARIVQLFYSDCQTGHCVAEFYAEGKWCLADATWRLVFADGTGRLLSAAECHASESGRNVYVRAYLRRNAELLRCGDEALYCRSAQQAAEIRYKLTAQSETFLAARLNCFGLINYPLPERPLQERSLPVPQVTEKSMF